MSVPSIEIGRQVSHAAIEAIGDEEPRWVTRWVVERGRRPDVLHEVGRTPLSDGSGLYWERHIEGALSDMLLAQLTEVPQEAIDRSTSIDTRNNHDIR